MKKRTLLDFSNNILKLLLNTLTRKKMYLSNGGEQGIRTLAPVSRPTPLAGEPLHHLGNSP